MVLTWLCFLLRLLLFPLSSLLPLVINLLTFPLLPLSGPSFVAFEDQLRFPAFRRLLIPQKTIRPPLTGQMLQFIHQLYRLSLLQQFLLKLVYPLQGLRLFEAPQAFW